MKKRLRIYAGPNGSGKSVLHTKLSSVVNNGYFVNADSMYNFIAGKNYYDFNEANIVVDDGEWKQFCKPHGLYAQSNGTIASEVINNILTSMNTFNSYDVAILSDFIRRKLIEKGDSFSCETVFSHSSKLDLLKKAKVAGYRTYLYFCCAGDPLVCVERVKQRVKEGGHDVPDDKIKQRFSRTLKQLLPAMSLVDRAYLFDNSGNEFELIMEKKDSGELQVHSDFLPDWVQINIIDKIC